MKDKQPKLRKIQDETPQKKQIYNLVLYFFCIALTSSKGRLVIVKIISSRNIWYQKIQKHLLEAQVLGWLLGPK